MALFWGRLGGAFISETTDSISRLANRQAVPYPSPRSPFTAGSESTPENRQRPILCVCEAMTYKGQPPGGLDPGTHIWILLQTTTLHFLCCQPLGHLSSVSHFIFCNKFLLGNYNSLRLEALIRNHLGHIKLFFGQSSHYFTPHSKCLILYPMLPS